MTYAVGTKLSFTLTDSRLKLEVIVVEPTDDDKNDKYGREYLSLNERDQDEDECLSYAIILVESINEDGVDPDWEDTPEIEECTVNARLLLVFTDDGLCLDQGDFTSPIDAGIKVIS